MPLPGFGTAVPPPVPPNERCRSPEVLTYPDDMSIRGIVAMAGALAVLLSGCAPSATPTPQQSEPGPTASHPAFMAGAQGEVDLLPTAVATSMRIDPASSRYQGAWDDHEIFLAVTGADSVCLVTDIPGDDRSWKAGCGDGDGVVTQKLPDGAIVKYLPMATTAAPEGWTRLSDHVFAM